MPRPRALAKLRYMNRRASLLALLLAACGARTGLEVPETSVELDATVAIDAARFDAAPDAPLADVGVPDRFVPPDAFQCIPGSFALTPAGADVVFMIDRSGSMRLTFEGTEQPDTNLWRWTFLRAALDESFDLLGERVRFGAKFFPAPIFDPDNITAREACLVTPGIDVPIAPNNRAAFLAQMDVALPLGGTPTAAAMREARAALQSSLEGRRFIVLATDGGPNCNAQNPDNPRRCVCTSERPACLQPETGRLACLDDDGMLAELDATFTDAGVPVFVIGITDDSRPDLNDFLGRMAVAGGRARTVPNEPPYYSVQSSLELRDAFDQITASIGRCGFVSPSVPTGNARFTLELDGVPLAEDPANGWTWINRSVGEIELHGDACARSELPGATVAAILDDCPL